MTDLHMFDNDFDRVIAHDLDEALAVFAQFTGSPYEGDREDWWQVPDDSECGLILIDENMDSDEARPEAWPDDFVIEKWEHPHYDSHPPHPLIKAAVRRWCEHLGEPQYFSCTEW